MNTHSFPLRDLFSLELVKSILYNSAELDLNLNLLNDLRAFLSQVERMGKVATRVLRHHYSIRLVKLR